VINKVNQDPESERLDQNWKNRRATHEIASVWYLIVGMMNEMKRKKCPKSKFFLIPVPRM
jgi:hypothetical protein